MYITAFMIYFKIIKEGKTCLSFLIPLTLYKHENHYDDYNKKIWNYSSFSLCKFMYCMQN